MKTPILLAAGLLLALAAGPAWARGGGGCLQEGTAILTPTGTVPIQDLRAGDTVVAVTPGGARAAVVRAIVKVQPPDYVELSFGGAVLRVTGEHPIAAGTGEFRCAEVLQSGQALTVWSGGKPAASAITSVRRVPADRPAYNLLVGPGGTYVANGLLVHNKGCFLPDTPILRADGTRVAIRDIRPGDDLLAFRPDGTIVTARVRRVLTAEVDEYIVVTAERAVLRVTADHPFYVGGGVFRTLGALKAGDVIHAHDGRHALVPQRIHGLQRIRAKTTVYNLQTDEPNTFFADGVAVHNKGGGCLPAGTPILTPEGDRPIETLAAGNVVLAVDQDGRLVPAVVQELLATRRPVHVMETDAGRLAVTADHPLMLGPGTFQEA